MAIRAVKTQHIERSLALGGVDHLANSEHWRAVRNTQKASGMGIGCCGIDLFVRVRNFQSVIVFQGGKKGDPVQRRLRQADEVLGGEVAGLDRKRFTYAQTESFDLNERTGSRQSKARRDFLLGINHSEK